MPMAKTDLRKLYKLIKQRVSRTRSRGRVAATPMLDALQGLLASPTIENAELFSIAEGEWLNAYRRSRNYVTRYGPKVVAAIRSGDFFVSDPPVWLHRDKDNSEGIVYLLASASMPGCLKLGATTRTLNERIEELRKKFNDLSLRAVYWIRVARPMDLERESQKALRAYRQRSTDARGSNEWFRLGSNSEAMEFFRVDAIDKIETAARDLPTVVLARMTPEIDAELVLTSGADGFATPANKFLVRVSFGQRHYWAAVLPDGTGALESAVPTKMRLRFLEEEALPFLARGTAFSFDELGRQGRGRIL